MDKQSASTKMTSRSEGSERFALPLEPQCSAAPNEPMCPVYVSVVVVLEEEVCGPSCDLVFSRFHGSLEDRLEDKRRFRLAGVGHAAVCQCGQAGGIAFLNAQ